MQLPDINNGGLITFFLASIGALATLLTLLVIIKTVDLWSFMSKIKDIYLESIEQEGEKRQREIRENIRMALGEAEEKVRNRVSERKEEEKE